MELSSVICSVLAVVSCVTCTPYGYGVKSGAAAKAEANAASGAFGVPVPLSIPSGGGFSGSFSKSSSSSFASSSASSSSSSSSYSFSGTGANSIPSTSHSSPGIPSGYGASGSIASAASGAKSIAGSSALSHNFAGLPCSGTNCYSSGITDNKCSSSECGSNGNQNNLNNNKNCLSGQCQPSQVIANSNKADVQTVNGPSNQPQTDLNDFEVNSGGKSKSNNNVNGYSSDSNKHSFQNTQIGTNTNEASFKPASSNYNGKSSTKNCNSPDSGCDIFIPLAPSGSAATTSLQQPSIHLTAPDVEPACATHDCSPTLTGANLNNGKPSSYHVPILGSNSEASPNYNSNTNPGTTLYNLPTGTPSKPDVTHKIPSYSDGIYSSQLPTASVGSPECNGPNCDSLHNPTYQYPSNPCKTPNCGQHTTVSGSNDASVQPGSGSILKPDNIPTHNAYPGYTNALPNQPKTNVLLPSETSPGYTGGFGGPTGSIDTNFGAVNPNIASTHGVKPDASIVPSSSYTGSFGGSPGSFDTPTGSTHLQSKPSNENPSSGLSTASYNNGISTGSQHHSFGLPKPNSGLPSGLNTPSYSSVSNPTNSADIRPNVQHSTFLRPAGTLDKPHGAAGVPFTGLHGSFGIKPDLGVTTPQQSATYTGGFGGSLGSFDTPTGSTPLQSKPSNENPSSGLNTASYNNGISTGSQHHSFGLPKPDSGVPSGFNPPSYSGVSEHTNSAGINPNVQHAQEAATYTGGFGGSPGTFDTASKIGTHVDSKLTHDKVPSSSSTTLSSYDQIHANSGITDNTESGSTYNSHDIQKPSKSVSPPNTETSYVSGSPNTGHFSVANKVSNPGLVKPVDEKAKLPPYLAGFGGPSGILKPNEYSVPTNIPTSTLTSCTSGNCGSTVGLNLLNGKENIQTSGASSDATASANAKAAAYSGSFGGPPGFLKPFDGPKNGQDGLTVNGEHEKSASGASSGYGNEHSVKHNEPSDINKGSSGSVTNAGANANAAAFASSGAISTNQGSTGCNSGCRSKPGTGGSYASSLGSSGVLEGHLLGSLASANSVAGAGAGSLGPGTSFASSSASAHASAGAAVKGGYGRR